MAERKSTAAEGNVQPAKKGLLDNKAILLGVIVITQAIVAIGLTHYFILPKLTMHNAAQTSGSITDVVAEAPQRGLMVGLGDIIVTLAGDSRRPRYLRVNINLEVQNKTASDAVVSRLPQMRDVVIMTLSDKSVEDLSKPGGKMNLRAEIFRRLDESISGGKLMNVYFSDLVIQ